MIEVMFHEHRVQDALLGQAGSLRNALEARIRQKLSGEILQAQSGALAASISFSVEGDETETSLSISSSGVPYAAIHEFGGKIAAHEIVAPNAKSLAFQTSGEQIFRKHVHHPGAAFPARSYLRSTLAEMQKDITSGFKQTILRALRYP